MPDSFELLRDVADVGLAPVELGVLRARVVAAVDAEIASPRSTGRRSRGRRWRLPISLGGLTAATVAVVAIAIAVLAIAVLHPRSATSVSPATSGNSAAGLVAKLAVLRRPQTATDKLPADLPRGPFGVNGKIIPGYTRFIASARSVRFYLVVTTPAPASPGARRLPPLWSPSLGDQVAVVGVTRRGSSETPGVPAAALGDGMGIYPVGDLYRVGIVPDGVTSVHWVVQLSDRPGQNAVDEIEAATVQGNLAYAPFARLQGPVVRADWRGAAGQVIPNSDRVYLRAVAAQALRERAVDIRYAETHAHPASAAMLAGRTPAQWLQHRRDHLPGLSAEPYDDHS